MFEILMELLDPIGAVVIIAAVIAFLLWEERQHTKTTRRKEPTRCGKRTRQARGR